MRGRRNGTNCQPTKRKDGGGIGRGEDHRLIGICGIGHRLGMRHRFASKGVSRLVPPLIYYLMAFRTSRHLAYAA
eukprot:6331391-Pyramimonas_sp.AAC.1